MIKSKINSKFYDFLLQSWTNFNAWKLKVITIPMFNCLQMCQCIGKSVIGSNIHDNYYWSANCLLTLDRVFETSRRFDFSTRSLGHVNRREVSKTRSKLSKQFTLQFHCIVYCAMQLLLNYLNSLALWLARNWTVPWISHLQSVLFIDMIKFMNWVHVSTGL